MGAYSFAQVVELSLLDLWSRLVSVLPDMVGALVVIIVGLIVAPILGGVVKKIIDVLRVDDLASRVGLTEMLRGYSDKFSISTLIGKLVKWFFLLVFILAASDVLGWTRISQFINEIIFYIPQVLIAVIILVFGVIAGKFFETIVTQSIKGSQTPVDHPETLGKITKWAFIIFAALAAMLQLGIAPSLIQIFFAGFVLALSLAFGLGGRDKAAQLLDHVGGTAKRKTARKSTKE
ncbi:hypothetical protein H6775_01250 [Candidatus Nomurabacteria bacterium]|nr:hypothetical protein [Candidatus Nomurabacteria bacterium]